MNQIFSHRNLWKSALEVIGAASDSLYEIVNGDQSNKIDVYRISSSSTIQLGRKLSGNDTSSQTFIQSQKPFHEAPIISGRHPTFRREIMEPHYFRVIELVSRHYASICGLITSVEETQTNTPLVTVAQSFLRKPSNVPVKSQDKVTINILTKYQSFNIHKLSINLDFSDYSPKLCLLLWLLFKLSRNRSVKHPYS